MELDLMEAIARRCTAENRNGERCGRVPIAGGTVCIFHGGRTPGAIAAARARLAAMVEPALDHLLRLLEQRPPCPTCGRSDADRDPVVLRACQLVLDRAGFHPTLTVEHEHHTGLKNAPWVEYFTTEQLRLMVEWKEEAIRRMEAGEPLPSVSAFAPVAQVTEGTLADEAIQVEAVPIPVGTNTPEKGIAE